MKLVASSVVLAGLVASVGTGCAVEGSDQAGVASASPEVVAKGLPGEPPIVERVVVHCHENVDHGAEVSFYAAPGSDEITRAEYTETTFVETKLVGDMRVCRVVLDPDGTGGLIWSCNDVLFRDGWDVELVEGGFAGIATARLYQLDGTSGQRVLRKSLVCQRVED